MLGYFFIEFVSTKEKKLREFVDSYGEALKKIVDIIWKIIYEHKDKVIDESNLILKHVASIYPLNFLTNFVINWLIQFITSLKRETMMVNLMLLWLLRKFV